VLGTLTLTPFTSHVMSASGLDGLAVQLSANRSPAWYRPRRSGVLI